ncbi:MAG TPA: urea ABC transporter permease subunit UrtB [Burkholderiaceae bacterium]|nr:urea ABC transporter permease subunit UrtB [Burkholderiaceae bacterium]
MRVLLAALVGLTVLTALVGSRPAHALPSATLAPLADDDSDEQVKGIAAIAASGDPLATRILEALGDGRLYFEDGRGIFVEDDKPLKVEDGTPAPAPKGDAITANNLIRAEVETALSGMKLADPDRTVRLAAARELSQSAGAGQRDAVARALQALTASPDQEIDALLKLALARIDLQADDVQARVTAAKALSGSDDPLVKTLLSEQLRSEEDPAARKALQEALETIDQRLSKSEYVARVLTGISLGSVLLLAALGLAITYGVMGIINMAHGEFLMIGAYATWLVQGFFRSYLPDHVDWYLAAAIPVAFIAAALIGVLIERLVIRHLYGRPLETLLATFGVSLVLAQASRSIFGAQNVELANPSWLSGGLQVTSALVLPWNRIGIVVFSLLVLAAVALVLTRTRLGLYIRAVTQNRRMAACMGVPTGMTDAMAFALGAGIAGLGGVAISQFTNVGPDMGGAYIVDSFMVVVVGGVGQLAGAVIASFGLGVISKFLESWQGAVIAKIIVLVIIIFFIQRRPQGLFAVKGRG